MKNSTRKKKLLNNISDMMRGALSQTSSTCGKPNCKTCKEGRKHTRYLFTYQVKGTRKVVSVPKKFHDKVQELVENWYEYKDLIEEITELNIKLMQDGELE